MHFFPRLVFVTAKLSWRDLEQLSLVFVTGKLSWRDLEQPSVAFLFFCFEDTPKICRSRIKFIQISEKSLISMTSLDSFESSKMLKLGY